MNATRGRVEIEIVPAGAFARAFPLVLGALFALGLAVTATIAFDEWWVLLAAAPVFVLAFAAVGVFAWAIRHPRARIEGGKLTVGRLPHVHVPVANLDLAAARVVDLDGEPALRPMFRLFGTGLPGFHSGWFLLRDRSRAFLVVTRRERVLVLPQRDGGPILLSAARPDAVLEALRRARG